MRWTTDFFNDVYGTVYRTVRGKKERLAITGDLVIKICDIVIFVQNNAWYCNTQMSTRYIVNMKDVYSQKLYYIVKWQKNTWYCNFPYNISTQILFKILDWKDDVPVVIGMFQKEVAKRIVSGPGNKDYGILSVLVQAYYHAEYLFDVPPQSFNPPPKVDSGVIKLTRRADVVDMRSEKSFIAVVKAAFGQRRKMLRNPLKGMFTPETLQEEIFTKRPEQLSVADFAALTFKMK